MTQSRVMFSSFPILMELMIQKSIRAHSVKMSLKRRKRYQTRAKLTAAIRLTGKMVLIGGCQKM